MEQEAHEITSVVESISKFIGNEDLPGADLQKSALLDIGKAIAIDDEGKKDLVDASTQELYKVAKSLPDFPAEGTLGPESELRFVQSLSKDDANRLAGAVTYFKHASEGVDGITDLKDVVSILKEIDNPIVKNILARSYYESSKDKLDPTALSELKEVGLNYDNYAKRPTQ